MAGRTHLVTGSASGIGRATRELLESRGDRVVGVDVRDADIVCDLADPGQRAGLRERVAALAPAGIDAVHAVAGVAVPQTITVRVNFFGAVATLRELRELLTGSAAPRAVAVSSLAALTPVSPELLAALRAEDEARAIEVSDALVEGGEGGLIYSTTKRAIAEWVRERSVTPEWAGAGIPLNAVGPGVIRTPMTAELMASPESREALFRGAPVPLNGPAEPINVAYLLAWLTSEENRHTTGQVIFSDSGADATLRGPRIFD
ncbi:SDR family oxidoreductase [Streptomyces hainanensis]|uniref:SDR family oxidoreductase n=1 Tax=Streptomyces hainanensis TaxID=402648 RepID=A0A4R4SV58_9ACTN|nr:SDR family oxidoreductase [Streptomyces hainanensis]TDC68070.1 SDR family oxidoreductase [Streptomyces hainanensis]